ncbi:MAG: carboxynorspermidine decarboxylase [Phycisphaeraceae bacterium]|nr:carboxynorspermidine decarboxylase [Phycisphaeraceae bacterium]
MTPRDAGADAAWADLPSPCYVIDEAALERNLAVIERLQEETGARVLLALKGFAAWALFPRMRRVLRGVAASSLNEARLGREFGGEVHVCAPAYRDDEFDELVKLCDHVTFNSLGQWHRFRERLTDVQTGLRINPKHSEVRVALYDPCAPSSRLGVTSAECAAQSLDGIEGMHLHTLCGLGADALERTLDVTERRFGRWLGRLRWVNLGGGHRLTAPGYDLARLTSLIERWRCRFDVDILLEPGEAVAFECGVLVTTVLDVVHRDPDVAILDTSASAHMPDVLEMPYRPPVTGSGEPGEKPHLYRLAGVTCLAGDVIGDYAFDEPLRPGDRVVFEDMAHYTMVKNTTFNGVGLPAIAVRDAATGATRVVRQFGYEDYRGRLS